VVAGAFYFLRIVVKTLNFLFLFSLLFFGHFSAMNLSFETDVNDGYSTSRNYDFKNLSQDNKFRIVYVATNKVVKQNTARLEDLTETMNLWAELFESFFIPLTIIWGFSCGFRY
jgi:hypothetical protein